MDAYTPIATVLPRLLQLASPTLPVGAYSYSQGLEHAVEAGIVIDEASAAGWIADCMQFTVGSFEGPLFARMFDAAERGAPEQLRALNATFLAARESSELRAETVQMGRSLCRLLGELDEARPALTLLETLSEPSYPCAWACAASVLQLPRELACNAYMWSWAENQVMAAVKLVPLGQSAGQRILMQLGARIPAIVATWADDDDDSLCNFAPGLALASSAHETQYSRLFRS